MRSKIQKSGVKRQKATGNRNAGCGMEVRKEIGVKSKVKRQDEKKILLTSRIFHRCQKFY